MKINTKNGTALASRMTKLAWDEAKVMGMGVLQDRGPSISEEEIFEMASSPGNIHADYINGRMMKLHFTYGPDFVEYKGGEWRGNYQSFCFVYPNFEALAKAAEESLK